MAAEKKIFIVLVSGRSGYLKNEYYGLIMKYNKMTDLETLKEQLAERIRRRDELQKEIDELEAKISIETKPAVIGKYLDDIDEFDPQIKQMLIDGLELSDISVRLGSCSQRGFGFTVYELGDDNGYFLKGEWISFKGDGPGSRYFDEATLPNGSGFLDEGMRYSDININWLNDKDVTTDFEASKDNDTYCEMLWNIAEKIRYDRIQAGDFDETGIHFSELDD